MRAEPAGAGGLCRRSPASKSLLPLHSAVHGRDVSRKRPQIALEEPAGTLECIKLTPVCSEERKLRGRSLYQVELVRPSCLIWIAVFFGGNGAEIKDVLSFRRFKDEG